jgi:HlyD family secretion protein
MKKRLPIILILVVVAGLAAWYFFVRQKARDGVLTLSGNIEVTESRLGFKIPGRLAERLVDEGADVKAGDVLARLDPVDQKQGLDRAIAQEALSKAALDELHNGSRPQEIASAQADLQRAQANMAVALSQFVKAKDDNTRYTDLYKRKVVSAQDFENYLTAFKAASSTLDATREQVRSSREQLSLQVEGPRVEEIEQGKARYEADKQARIQAEQQLAYTALYAPYAGVIQSKSAEAGDYLNPGSPVVSLAAIDAVWLRAYVNETDLGRIKVGQEATVTADSLPGKTFTGRVSFISDEAEFTPKSVQTFEERVKLVYRLKIDLANTERFLKPGMPADAKLQLQ